MKTTITNKEIESVKNKIIKEINPRRIYLFGSMANGTANDDSDLDLFIEIDNTSDIFRVKKLLNKTFINRTFPMDFKVETTQMINKNKHNSASFFNQVILNHGKLIYERR